MLLNVCIIIAALKYFRRFHIIVDYRKGLYRLATTIGLARPCFHASSLQVVSLSMSCETMGLGGIMDNNMAILKDDNGKWKEAKPIRTHARSLS